MSLRYEQYRSLKYARALLFALSNPQETKRVHSKIRNAARQALRHYPSLRENGEPIFSQDTFNV